MTDRIRRKELIAEYKQARPQAAVYRIVNRATGRGVLGSTANLAGVRNKLAFAQSTNTPGVLDQRLRDEIRRSGVDALPADDLTPAQLQRELAALEAHWREKLGWQ
jgi:hypothetical protein